MADIAIEPMVQTTIMYRNPDIMGGELIFVGTRVPVRYLFEHLAAGDTLEVFLDSYPSVTHEQAITATQLMEKYE